MLGDVIDRVIEDQIKRFHNENGGRWDKESWAEFLRLIDREAQKEHLGPVSSGFDPSSNVRLLPFVGMIFHKAAQHCAL